MLNKYSSEGSDYLPEDLPHYHLTNRTTRKQFRIWLDTGRRDFSIVGCWSRPLFSGGFEEDADAQTTAYNLQTPSLFIDMRFPVARPTATLQARKSVQACSDEELRYLARQHCFSGYSLPSKEGQFQYFTRHHIIDWNFHPSFPRPRPNKWWVELDQEDAPCQSFKEFSFSRDNNNVPVYFERWARIRGDSNGKCYLALRRKTGCPHEAVRRGKVPERDALLVVVGSHFALAVDRQYPIPTFEGAKGPGGPALVDHAVAQGDREAAEQYLSLEGSYGTVDGWVVKHSTHPWKEGERLLNPEKDVVLLVKGSQGGALGGLRFQGFEWEALECSFSLQHLTEPGGLFTGARLETGQDRARL